MMIGSSCLHRITHCSDWNALTELTYDCLNDILHRVCHVRFDYFHVMCFNESQIDVDLQNVRGFCSKCLIHMSSVSERAHQ